MKVPIIENSIINFDRHDYHQSWNNNNNKNNTPKYLETEVNGKAYFKLQTIIHSKNRWEYVTIEKIKILVVFSTIC